MWWISLITGALSAGVAVGIAVANRRWAQKDAVFSAEMEILRRRMAALEEASRNAARDIYDAIPWRWSRWLTESVDSSFPVHVTQQRFKAVASLRARIFLLPEPWRDRLDWLLVGIAHGFCDADIAEIQLRTDLRALLHGESEPPPTDERLRGLMMLLEFRNIGRDRMTQQENGPALPAA